MNPVTLASRPYLLDAVNETPALEEEEALAAWWRKAFKALALGSDHDGVEGPAPQRL